LLLNKVVLVASVLFLCSLFFFGCTSPNNNSSQTNAYQIPNNYDSPIIYDDAKTCGTDGSSTTYTITTSTSGTGSGKITSIPSCKDMVFGEGTMVNLIAVPAPGSTFDHWDGDCDGNGYCIVLMNSNWNVKAIFISEIAQDIVLTIDGHGCFWETTTDSYGEQTECLAISARGTAKGQVGARIQLLPLAWDDDVYHCSNWTWSEGNYCYRAEGQEETTIWSIANRSEECPVRELWNNNMKYTVRLYSDKAIKEVSSSTTCVDFKE